MKARIKATGEIVDVLPCAEEDGAVRFYANMKDKWYEAYEIDILSEVPPPDYWEKLKHQYAGMAMQGILANPEMMSLDDIDVAAMAIRIANITISKLKEESQCEK